MSSSTAAERENRLRRLKIYSGRDPLYKDMYKVSHAQFPDKPKPEVKDEKMKAKKGMSSKAGQQQPLICISLDPRKKKKEAGELTDDDREDVYRAFGATDGIRLVDSRESTLDEGDWH